jgi:hypothetical protein
MSRYRRILAGLIFILMPGLARSETVDLSGVTKCGISGWAADSDPAGINVRAGPAKDAPIIGTLPLQNDYAVEFEITGSRNGWFLISNAEARHYSDKPDSTVFAGPGWIAANLARFEIEGRAVRAAPRDDAPVLLKFEVDAAESAVIDHVFGCQGAFAEVELHLPDGPHLRGWVTRICSNQVTTCV